MTFPLAIRHVENRRKLITVGNLRCVFGDVRGENRDFTVQRGYKAGKHFQNILKHGKLY